mgnify:CR=1 FL=1
MSKKKEEKINLNRIPQEEQLKYEIAEELGVLDKVLEWGWKSLSAKETGRIGGLMTKRRREEKKKEENMEISWRMLWQVVLYRCIIP